jgi:hypothetical protein
MSLCLGLLNTIKKLKAKAILENNIRGKVTYVSVFNMKIKGNNLPDTLMYKF